MDIKLIRLSEQIREYKIDIGRIGDRNVTKIKFDFTEYISRYGIGQPALLFSPPNSGTTFPVVIDNDEWTVEDICLQKAGFATARIKWIVNSKDALKVSPEIKCRISIGADPEGAMPDPVESWVNDANRVLGEIPTRIERYVTEHRDMLKGDRGEKGETGEKGADGQPGKDGRDGIDGQQGLPGRDGVDGQPGKDGQNGADGYTPQRGTDYWSPADQAAINADIDRKIEAETATLKEALATQIPIEVDKAVDEKTGDFLKRADIADLETEVHGKLDKPVGTPTVGKVLKVNSVNADGSFTAEWADAVVEKPWVLKGTLTETGTINVDLTGCEELHVIGSTTGTANTNLNAVINGTTATLFSNITASGVRYVFASYEDGGHGIETKMSRFGSTRTTMNNVAQTTFIPDLKVSGISQLKFGNVQAVTSCSIDIYAR